MRVRISKEASAVAVAVTMAATAWFLPSAAPAGAAPDAGSVTSRAAGTWGACGSWWEETATEFTSGSVCGIDGVIVENGQPTQLAEPLVSVSRYVCSKTKRFRACTSESYQGAVRRTDMSVDPLLRRATIRSALGACPLDIEFVGVGPVQPQGNVDESHGLAGAPSVYLSGGQTFSSPANWWGHVCGQLVVTRDRGQGQMFRGAEASINNFAGSDGGVGHGDG